MTSLRIKKKKRNLCRVFSWLNETKFQMLQNLLDWLLRKYNLTLKSNKEETKNLESSCSVRSTELKKIENDFAFMV